ncbi:MAG: hypothetical protein JKY56_04485 [Kofleriaceae bacterium]|nr:hypothetical protein [Kofleriaceae bacterium]
MRILLSIGILLLFMGTASADKVPESDVVPKRTGVFVALGISTIDPIPGDVESKRSGDTFFGYRFGRVTVGMSARFQRYKLTFNSSEDGMNTYTLSELSFLPGVQMTVLKSEDERLELIGGINVGVVFRKRRVDSVGPAEESEANSVVYEGVTGLRYWLRSQVAVEVQAGLRGERYKISQLWGWDDITHSHSEFKSLNMIGVF